MQGRAVYASGAWEIDLHRRELRANRVAVPIGGRAFEILETLVASAGQLVTKDDLMTQVWPGAVVGENTLQVHISAIRKALGAERGWLKTASGRGYRLLGHWTARLQDGGAGRVNVTPELRAAQASRTTLPAAVSDLIGREAVVQHLQDLMSAYRVVTLTGPGGIGKTRLALEIARILLPAFEDDISLVELASLSDAGLVPAATARALGLDLGVNEVSAESLARAIGGRKFLLVIDNCEHVIDAVAGVVETIIRQCPAASVLATSREIMRIEGEFTYRVPPLDFPAGDQSALSPGDFLNSAAVQLFIARAKAWRPTLQRHDALPTIAAICRKLDGIHLAIEFAAARTETFGLEQLLSHLDDRFAFLTSGRRTALPKQRTLLATLDWSFELLPEIERVILRRLAVFAGGFTFEAACAVVATGEMRSQEVVDGVSNLVAKSLVVVEAGETATRCFLLETVRAYALAKLGESDETDIMMRRHVQFFCVVLGQMLAESDHRPLVSWLATYRRELDNIRAALDWAFSSRGDSDLAVMLVTAAIQLMFELSLVGELHQRAKDALRLVHSGVRPDPRCEMYLLAALQSTRVYTEGPSAAAFEAWETVVRLSAAQGDVACQARALWGLWNDHTYGGAPTLALQFAKRFIELAVAHDDTAKAILGERIIGISLHYHGDQPAARDRLEGFLVRYVLDKAGWVRMGARLNHATVARATLVRVMWLQGEPEKAMSLSEGTLRDAFAEDRLLATLYVLVESAIPLSFVLTDYESIERFLTILMKEAERSGYRIWQLYGRCFQEVLRIRQGKYETGLPRLRDAIGKLRESGFCAHLSMFLGILAGGQGEVGRVADGLTIIEEALNWSETRGEYWYRSELLRIKAEIVMRAASANAFDEAETLLRESLAVAHRQGALSWELRAATSLARALQQRRASGQARAVLSPVYERFSEGFGTADLVTARTLLDSL
jgi:predicted ATPase/DNA-binding winged helix-turn-helix (wHTH) protein